ncbi:dde superfamily endonuclease [Holotrichia oblita]|uniref:Dde superfamily endonuclease n=1 Tax=Holotrichia oblita TaxID=644536 RepID=A0ACB9SH17_HOLOL|nr:dde superfamily endonuclease [Holotrichia oblita]
MSSITLYCLPSNTTHELQPMDKAVFRAFEYYWDDEVLKYLSVHKVHSITKHRFGAIFSKVWDKALTPANIKSGFAAMGTYPYNKDAIPEIAFAPNTVTNQNFDCKATTNEPRDLRLPLTPMPSTSGLRNKNPKKRQESLNDSDSGSDMTLHDDDFSDSDSSEGQDSFQALLPTPDEVSTKRKSFRKPALNCKAQVVTKDLFQKQTTSGNDTTVKNSSAQKRKGKISKESWFCKVCREDRIADMSRLSCRYYLANNFKAVVVLKSAGFLNLTIKRFVEDIEEALKYSNPALAFNYYETNIQFSCFKFKT